MKVQPSALTPFLRSDAQGAVLAEVLLHPDVELSISEIGRRAALLPAVAHREVTRLIEGGVLVDRREGNSRLVRANSEHPLSSLMARLVMETYGPVPVLRELLVSVAGVEAAYVYGSWAARRSGDPGPPPRDLDVLVVGTPERVELLDVADRARERLRLDVNIRAIASQAWSQKSDAFLRTLASRPLVEITLPREEPHG